MNAGPGGASGSNLRRPKEVLQDLIQSVDMTHNRRAWSTIKKINNDPKTAKLHSNFTADHVAHQLLLSGKTQHKTRHRRVTRRCGDMESTWQFTDEELQAAIDCLKNGKAAGLDDIRTEQIKHCDFPVYLGVTLDRALSYKQHIDKVKAK